MNCPLSARRAGLDPRADLRPMLTAAVALAAFDTGLNRWADGDGAEDLALVTDRAFGLAVDTLNGCRSGLWWGR